MSRRVPDVTRPPSREERLWSVFVLLPLLTLVATHTEIGGDPQAAGIAVLVRLVAFAALVGAGFARGCGPGHPATIYLGFGVSAYVLIVNASSGTNFAVLASAFIWLACIFAAQTIHEFHRANLVAAVRLYIVIGVAALAADYAFTSIGMPIDFHRLVFPWSAAREGEFLGVQRLSGLQIEPGTYANTVFLMALLSGLLRRRVYGHIEAIGVASALLTLSAWAPIGLAAFIVASSIEYLLSNRTKQLQRVGVFLAVFGAVLIILPVLVIDYSTDPNLRYFADRFTIGERSGSAIYKVIALQAWLVEFGNGMWFARPIHETFCEYCLAPQDLGTLPNMAFYLGALVPIALILAITHRLVQRFPGQLVLLAALTVTKFYWYDPLVWAALMMALMMPGRKYFR